MPLRPRDLPAAYRREHGLDNAPKPKPRVPKEQDHLRDVTKKVERAPVEYRGGVLNGTMHLFAPKRYLRQPSNFISRCMRETGTEPDWEGEGTECLSCYAKEQQNDATE